MSDSVEAAPPIEERHFRVEDLPRQGVTIAGRDYCEPRRVDAYLDDRGRLWRTAHECATIGLGSHVICDCGRYAIPRSSAECSACEVQRRRRQWEELEKVEYRGHAPAVILGSDIYFSGISELFRFLKDHPELGTGQALQLVSCKRDAWPELCREYFEDDIFTDDPECCRLPDKALECIDRLNEILRRDPPPVWHQAPDDELVGYTIEHLFDAAGV